VGKYIKYQKDILPLGQRWHGVTLNMDIPFQNNEEGIKGYALRTADILGQMSADDYIKKVPILYNEFVEAYRFEGLDKKTDKGRSMPESADDFIRSTPAFYESVALERFKLMGLLHEYLRLHFDSSDNPCLSAIEKTSHS